MTYTRRDLLKVGGVSVAAAALGGCLGGSGGGGVSAGATEGSTRTAESTPQSTPTPTGTQTDARTTATYDAHPVTADIDAQPRLGPADAPVQIVAFEDPSCPRCRAFERTTVPEIRSELVEPGEGSFVVRNAPLVYPWGEPAIYALEATYARDADAYWGLLAHYFEEQSSFDRDNVRSKTATWLSANTELDGEAVVEAADGEEAAAAVAADVDAAETANVTGTPTVFLFSEGSYVTRATGSISFDLISTAVGR